MLDGRSSMEPSAEDSTIPAETFNFDALRSNLKDALQLRLTDASELKWMQPLGAILSEGNPSHAAECEQAASEGLRSGPVASFISSLQRSWLSYMSQGYPDNIKAATKLPNPNREAQARKLDQAAMVSAYEQVTRLFKEQLLQKVGDDKPLEAIEADDEVNQSLSDNLAAVQANYARQAHQLCEELQTLLPLKDSRARLGATILRRSRLAVDLKKDKKVIRKADQAAQKLVGILKILGDTSSIGAAAAIAVPKDLLEIKLSSRYSRMATVSIEELAEQLQQVPTSFVIPAEAKPKSKRSPTPVPLPKPNNTFKPLPEEKELEPIVSDAETAKEEETVEAGVLPSEEKMEGPTAAEIMVKGIYKKTLEKYYEEFSRQGFRRPQLAQLAGVLRKVPDDARKVCIFLVLASYSGDNRAIHDAFVAIDNIPEKHYRSPLYALCAQAYARTGSMPEQYVDALAKMANPDLILPLKHQKLIQAKTAFTDQIPTNETSVSTAVQITARVTRQTLTALLGELDIVFPPAQKSKTNFTPEVERRQSQYVQLPALNQERVKRVLEKLGCEVNSARGKGSHERVFNPATETSTNLTSDHGEVNPIPLRSMLAQLGISDEAFIQAL